MPKLQERLEAGLESQGWLQTRSRSASWNRWAKFGRGAMYVLDPEINDRPKGSLLWFSELHITEPQVPVYGPIYEQVLLAGDAWLAQSKPDTEALLIELMYRSDERVKHNGGED